MVSLAHDPQVALEALGWSLVLAGILCGAAIGLGFHRESFLGGYASLRRRLIRLGHVALVALGVLALEFARSGAAHEPLARVCFAIGAVGMPAACFLVAWRARLRFLFALPVAALAIAALLALHGVLR